MISWKPAAKTATASTKTMPSRTIERALPPESGAASMAIMVAASFMAGTHSHGEPVPPGRRP
jgi:hypothetical protein